jgi:hypothetical protein
MEDMEERSCDILQYKSTIFWQSLKDGSEERTTSIVRVEE